MHYQSRISYRLQDVTGKWKTYSESFLHDAVSFSEVETQLYEFLKNRVKDFDVKAIAQVTFEEVYTPLVGAHFYKVTVETDEGDGKKLTAYHLVGADDVKDAEVKAKVRMKDWLSSTTILAVAQSKILGFWHPKSEEWQSDFRNRMDRLADEGHESPDINQLEMNFESSVEADDHAADHLELESVGASESLKKPRKSKKRDPLEGIGLDEI